MPKTRVRGSLPRTAQLALGALFINVSYGTLSYSFSVLVTASAAGGAFGTRAVALGFSLGLLVSGFSALAVGAAADARDPRRVLAFGAALGAVGLAGFAAAREVWQAVLVLAFVCGPALAATAYEPLYVLVNRWYSERERPRAYALLTLLSGVSISIFVPLTRALVDALGWRGAVLALAALLLAVGVAVPAFLTNPAPPARGRPVAAPRIMGDIWEGLRTATAGYWAFTALVFAASVAFMGAAFHIVAQLEARGFEPGPVAAAVAVTGLVSLPGRFLLPALAARVSATVLLAGAFAGLAAALLVASAASQWWHVWAYVGAFGVVFGAVYPLRALAVSQQFGGEQQFGRLLGVQALAFAAARAAGPAAFAAVGTTREAYEVSYRGGAAALLVVSVALFALARSARRSRPSL